MYNIVKAKDIMAKKLVTLKPTDDIYLGLRVLLENNISGAPVIDEDGTFLGFFTEKSCMNVVIADQYHGMAQTEIRSFTFPALQTISPNTSLIDIAMIFFTRPFRRLPVLDNGQLVGQVSRRDVLRGINETRKKMRKSTKSKPPAPIPYSSALIDPRENETPQI